MSRVATRFLVVAMATLLATGFLTARPLPVLAAGSISLTTLGSPYTQDFLTLATLGMTNTIDINGWDLLETGTNANQQYAAGTGSSNTGDTYSFGASRKSWPQGVASTVGTNIGWRTSIGLPYRKFRRTCK